MDLQEKSLKMFILEESLSKKILLLTAVGSTFYITHKYLKTLLNLILTGGSITKI